MVVVHVVLAATADVDRIVDRSRWPLEPVVRPP
jgi:hypothetical protein